MRPAEGSGVIGRDAELDLVDGARHRGITAVVIGGAAGVGKTRLVRAAIERARLDGWAVEEVFATASAREIPLAACAGLWDASGDEISEVATSRVVHEVRSRMHGPTLLAVDDAHLLDAPSAHVIALLARERDVTCLLTVRTGERVPDAVLGMWKDAECDRIELQALSRSETVDLAAGLLGGQVELATGRRLFDRCGGNVLFLRELLASLRRSGSLDQSNGIWRWTGDTVVSATLDEMIEARIDLIPEKGRRVLEMVTFGEPIELGVVVELGFAEEVEALERGGLVELGIDGRRWTVRLSHPLFSDATRRHVGKLEARRIYANLSGSLSTVGGRRRNDAFRLAVWQLNAGTSRDPRILLKAAREARARGDSDLVGRLAAAAADIGGGLEARMLVAQALMDRGEDVGSLEMLRELVTESGPDALRARVAELLAAHLATSFGRYDEARAVLDGALETIVEPDARALLEALQVALHPHSARDRLNPPIGVRTSNDGDDTTVLLRWLGTAHADLTAGRFAGVEAASHEMLQRAGRLRDDRPESLLWVTVLRWYALVHCGRLDDAEALGLDALNRFADHPYGRTRAWYVDMLGTLALIRGDALAALHYLEDATTVRRVDDRGSLTGSLLALTAARALIGDAEGADATYLESTNTTTSVLAPFVSAPRADAARLAAGGRLPSARKIIVEHARDCHDRSLALFELWAWRDAARYGAAREAADGLQAMLGRVDPPLPDVFAVMARARADNDPESLEHVAGRFVELGLMLDAAESLAIASRHANEQGDLRRARRCSAALDTMRPKLAGADTPALRGGVAAGVLSERELEIALLAASGRKDADIAETLVVSVRTVHAHLRSVYTKLGITRRTEITGALDRQHSSLQ